MKEITLDPKKAVKEVEELFDTYLKDRKDAIYSMLYEKEISSNFFTCPASSQLDRHCAFEGGLIVHSLSVTKILLELREQFNIITSAGDESIVIVGMFHDLGKIGDEYGPQYLPETDNWWIKNKGRMYQNNKDIQYMPHSLRSLYILQQNNVPVNVDEYFAINYHDSFYLKQFEDVKFKESSLYKALHFADMWSMQELEQRFDPDNPMKDQRPW